MRKRLYLSGKITGLSIEDAEAIFMQAQIEYESRYFEVINPMRLPHDHSHSWAAYMLENLAELSSCHAIAMLPNWKDSPGAEIEYLFAKRIGLEILFYES